MKGTKVYKRITILVTALFLCSIFSLFVGVFAAGVDVSLTGLDLLSSPPAEETVYTAGEGTVTYTPAADENSCAVITLNNAQLTANTRVTYWSPNWCHAALAAKGDVEIVLVGESEINFLSLTGSAGLLVYDGNMTIKGSGSLSMGFQENEFANSIQAIDVMSDYDVFENKEEYEKGGNFTIESGALNFDLTNSISSVGINASNNIQIDGGNITGIGQSKTIYSVYGDVVVSGGRIEARQFGSTFLYARRGSIQISGESTILEAASTKSYSTGINAGSMDHLDTDSVEAGNIVILGGKIKLQVSYIGLFAQYLPSVPNSGNIEISGGEIVLETLSGSEDIGAAIFAQGEDAPENCASVTVSGGNLTAQSGGERGVASVGIYADGGIAISGGQHGAASRKSGYYCRDGC